MGSVCLEPLICARGQATHPPLSAPGASPSNSGRAQDKTMVGSAQAPGWMLAFPQANHDGPKQLPNKRGIP
jgi:hypothetical protein